MAQDHQNRVAPGSSGHTALKAASTNPLAQTNPSMKFQSDYFFKD
jgi:hypothetical protein